MTAKSIAQQLAKAARLRTRRALTDAEYSVIAIKLIYALRGKPLVTNTEVRATELRDETLGDLRAIKPGAEFGPYDQAVHLIGVSINPSAPLPWNWIPWQDALEELHTRSQLKLTARGRRALALEEWLGRQRRLFPNLAPWVERIIIALLAFVFGLITGHFLGAGKPSG